MATANWVGWGLNGWGWNVTVPATDGLFSGSRVITRAPRQAGARRSVTALYKPLPKLDDDIHSLQPHHSHIPLIVLVVQHSACATYHDTY